MNAHHVTNTMKPVGPADRLLVNAKLNMKTNTVTAKRNAVTGVVSGPFATVALLIAFFS